MRHAVRHHGRKQAGVYRFIATTLLFACGMLSSPYVAKAELPLQDVTSSQELQIRLGGSAGKRVTPGGLLAGADFLYRLSAVDWFEGSAQFVLGDRAAGCFADRSFDTVCQHDFFSGFSSTVFLGFRRYFLANNVFAPFFRAQLGIRFVRFDVDDVKGVAIPLAIGAGVRARLTEVLAMEFAAAISGGPGWFNQGLGTEPQLGASITAGVVFRLPE